MASERSQGSDRAASETAKSCMRETHVKNSQRLRLSARWKLRHFNTAMAAFASMRFSLEYITAVFEYRSEYRKT